nr:MAG TPA: hypothetical protein [Caudoviricetes sp.]
MYDGIYQALKMQVQFASPLASPLFLSPQFVSPVAPQLCFNPLSVTLNCNP